MTNDLIEQLINACADAEILWRKRRQHAQGRINMGSVYEFDEDYCTEQMSKYRQLHEKLSFDFAKDDWGA